MRRSTEDIYKKLLPLKTIARDSFYSLGYVSVLVQRKKLKAKKIGNKYFTSREWFDQYLELHAREEKRLSAPGKKDTAVKYENPHSSAQLVVRKKASTYSPVEEKKLAETLKRHLPAPRAVFLADLFEPEHKLFQIWRNYLHRSERDFKKDIIIKSRNKAGGCFKESILLKPVNRSALAFASFGLILFFVAALSWQPIKNDILSRVTVASNDLVKNIRHRNQILARKFGALENNIKINYGDDFNALISASLKQTSSLKNFLDNLPDRARVWGKNNLALLNNLNFQPRDGGQPNNKFFSPSLVQEVQRGRVAGARETADQEPLRRLIALANLTAQRGQEVFGQAKDQAAGVLRNSADRQIKLSFTLGDKLALLTRSAATGVGRVSESGKNKLAELGESIDRASQSVKQDSVNGQNLLVDQADSSLASLTDLYARFIEKLLPEKVKFNKLTIASEKAVLSGTLNQAAADERISKVEIIDPTEIAADSSNDALLVKQAGAGEVADFQAGEVSVLKIKSTGQVSIIGTLTVQGKVVAGAFEGWCESGYVWVPGSAKYGTKPGFCVGIDLAGNNLNQAEAELACRSLGSGYHLISENEWLTMADDLSQVADNNLNIASTLKFTNDNQVNDLTGRLAEWTDRVVTEAGLPAVPSLEAWHEYSEVIDFKGLEPPPYYLTDKVDWIGKIYVGAKPGHKGFVRGQGGIYGLDLSHAPDEKSPVIGYRCAK